MNIDFSNEGIVRKLTLMFSLSNVGAHKQYTFYVGGKPK